MVCDITYRVIVMSDGRFEEVDKPDKLKEDTNSLFYAMAKDAGLVWKVMLIHMTKQNVLFSMNVYYE